MATTSGLVSTGLLGPSGNDAQANYHIPDCGLWGDANVGAGVLGSCNEGFGVVGIKGDHTGWFVKFTQDANGKWQPSLPGAGVYGYSDWNAGVVGQGNDLGVEGDGGDTGVLGVGDKIGVVGYAGSNSEYIPRGPIGVYGDAANGVGVHGSSTYGDGLDGRSQSGEGVYGHSLSGSGLFGYSKYENSVVGYKDDGSPDLAAGEFSNVKITGRPPKAFLVKYGLAGRFIGNVEVSGNLSVSGSKYFRIDHPLDPANKYLYHSSVESPDMKNIYDGVVSLGKNGEAEVALPAWFEALNKDYRYQLTAVGEPAPGLYVARQVANGTFAIAGGTPGMKVSWQVTGIRQDVWANANRIPVEVPKRRAEKGMYQHPELFKKDEKFRIPKKHLARMAQKVGALDTIEKMTVKQQKLGRMRNRVLRVRRKAAKKVRR